MAEPTSSAATAAATFAPVALGLMLPNVDPETLIGAFGGAVVFVMHARNFTIARRLVYMIVSIILGYLGSSEVMHWTNIQSPSVAAFIAGALVVTVSLVVLDSVRDLDLSRWIPRR